MPIEFNLLIRLNNLNILIFSIVIWLKLSFLEYKVITNRSSILWEKILRGINYLWSDDIIKSWLGVSIKIQTINNILRKATNYFKENGSDFKYVWLSYSNNLSYHKEGYLYKGLYSLYFMKFFSWIGNNGIRTLVICYCYLE